MKICYVANSCIPSRLANTVHVMKMCQAYQRLGHEVTLVVPDWLAGKAHDVDDVYDFYDVDERFPIVRVPMPKTERGHTFFYSVTFPWAVARLDSDVVHARVLTSAWSTAALFRQPTILELHHPPPSSPSWRFFFDRSVRSRKTIGLIAITHALAEKYLRPAVPEATRILVAPDGVDESWLRDGLSTADARTQVGLPSDPRPLAVYTGHLYRGRGIELILELAARVPEYQFLIVGGHPGDVARYQEMAGERENIRFLGFKPPSEMHLYQLAADVLLMPYADRVEIAASRVTADFASPLKMFEYMAAGRPILSSSLPVLKEILRDGHNALLLPYERTDAWQSALQQLQAKPAWAKSLGDQARADVRAFTWERRAEQIVEFAQQSARLA